MNPRNNPTCVSSTSHGFSTTSGHGIKGHIINVSRMLPKRTAAGSLFLKGQLDGRQVATYEEATRLGLEYGVLHYYGRNVCEFVMSRAARKRGWATTNWRYLQNQERSRTK